MLKLDFSDEEMEKFKKKIHFTKRQLRIIEYRRTDELTIIQMAEKEICGEATISREIAAINKKIKKEI